MGKRGKSSASWAIAVHNQLPLGSLVGSTATGLPGLPGRAGDQAAGLYSSSTDHTRCSVALVSETSGWFQGLCWGFFSDLPYHDFKESDEHFPVKLKHEFYI